MRPALGLVLFASLCWAQKEPVPPRPPVTPQDVAQGERLFGGSCAPCHGPRGDGGRGANLTRPKLRHASDITGLFKVVRDGVEGTEMPGAWQMNDRELWQVVAFVETLGRQSATPVPGDPVEGERIFRGKGNCLQCHTAEVPGGRTGPELTDIGARRSVTYLKRALLEPEAVFPEDFLQVRLTTQDGQSISGIRLAEDTFTIQVRDFSDELHSFRKSELTAIDKQHGKSPMPSYQGTLNDTELQDLLAYLVSLRGD